MMLPKMSIVWVSKNYWFEYCLSLTICQIKLPVPTPVTHISTTRWRSDLPEDEIQSSDKNYSSIRLSIKKSCTVK